MVAAQIEASPESDGAKNLCLSWATSWDEQRMAMQSLIYVFNSAQEGTQKMYDVSSG